MTSKISYAIAITYYSFLEHSCVILSSFKIVIIFNNASGEIKTKSADVLLKMITILKELRVAQLCSKNEWTLMFSWDNIFKVKV